MSVINPNFSIVMPTGCNAKCSFCYWEPEMGSNLDKFKEVIRDLPPEFEQCSITGGEPTMANDLMQWIRVANKRFGKVVLNTNGYKLTDAIIQSVDFVNISVHHYDRYSNCKIFGTDTVPDKVQLKEMCKHGNVTFNCVLDDGFADFQFIMDYIKFAKYCGAKVAFRKYYSDLTILDKVDLDDTLTGEHSCGACLHRYHKINDVDVTFKYSVPETNECMSDPYEVILQANGKATYDWAGKKEVDFSRGEIEQKHFDINEMLNALDSDPVSLFEQYANTPQSITFDGLHQLTIPQLEVLADAIDKNPEAQGCNGPRHKTNLTIFSIKKQLKKKMLERKPSIVPFPKEGFSKAGCGKSATQCGQSIPSGKPGVSGTVDTQPTSGCGSSGCG